MRNFYRISSGLNFGEILHSLTRQPELWNTHNFRTTFPGTPHTDIDDILLRFSKPEACAAGIERVANDSDCVWYPAFKLLPEIKQPLLDILHYSKAYALDRLLITRLRPGGQILPHTDKYGSYTNTGDIERIHAVIQGLPGSNFVCGEEVITMRTGEIWWFNPFEVHSCVNNSEGDRIHMLIDLRYMP